MARLSEPVCQWAFRVRTAPRVPPERPRKLRAELVCFRDGGVAELLFGPLQKRRQMSLAFWGLAAPAPSHNCLSAAAPHGSRSRVGQFTLAAIDLHFQIRPAD